jgi:hypothetical protein
MSNSFLTDLSDFYRKFDIGFGVPSNGRIICDKYFPYDISVFDKVSVGFQFTNLVISSPTYKINEDIVSFPSFVREQGLFSKNDPYDNDESVLANFYSYYNLFYEDVSGSSQVVVDGQDVFSLNSFLQVPLTLEGENANHNVDIGVSNDIHLTWQSNRLKTWDIYYSSTLDNYNMFKFDTLITKSSGNNLAPDVSVNSKGQRLIAWHSNRDDNYKIYGARTIDSDENYNKFCKNIALLEDPPYLEYESPTISFNSSSFSGIPGIYHFRINFYSSSDSSKTSLLYSSFSMIDNKRWFYSNNGFFQLLKSGLVINENDSFDIIYSTEIYPHDLAEIQEQKNSDEDNDFESSLLCGVSYTVEIEAYNEDTGDISLISSFPFIISCSESNLLDFDLNLDSSRWICSGQGKDDIVVANSGDQSLYSAIDSNVDNLFSIIWESKRNNLVYSINGFWRSDIDYFYSSGQGYYEQVKFNDGKKPNVLVDKTGNFYLFTFDENSIYSYNCPFPEIDSEEEDISESNAIECLPGYDLVIPNFMDTMQIRVYSEDQIGSLTINSDKVVSVVEKVAIRFDIVNSYGAYAVRIKNGGGEWSKWRGIDNDINQEDIEDTQNKAYWIDNNRFVVPWDIDLRNGIQRVSFQILTFYGVTNVKSVDLFMNKDILSYYTEFYLDSAMENKCVQNNGFYLLSNLSENTYSDIYVKVIFNEEQNYNSGDLKFDFIHPGLTDQYGLSLVPDGIVPTDVYKGQFKVYNDDGIFNKDGLGFIRVIFPDNVVTNCISDISDSFNLMLNKDDLRTYDDSDSQLVRSEMKKNNLARALNINEFKQYYDIDDSNFNFGNSDFFRK